MRLLAEKVGFRRLNVWWRLRHNSGQLVAARKEAQRLKTDMRHVEAVIRMFDPAYDVRRITVRRRNRENPWFRRGTMFRAALDVLRTATGPMTSREIAERLLADKGATPTLPQLRDLVAGLNSCLRRFDGKAVRNVAEGMPARWVVA